VDILVVNMTEMSQIPAFAGPLVLSVQRES